MTVKGASKRTADAWLTAADIAWRPDIEDRALDWSLLRVKQKEVRTNRFWDVDYESQRALREEMQKRYEALDEDLVLTTLAMHRGRRASKWLRMFGAFAENGLPAFGQDWKLDLLSRARGWEFRQWQWRIEEQAAENHIRHDEMLDLLLTVMSIPDGFGELTLTSTQRDELANQDVLQGYFSPGSLRRIFVDRVAWRWQLLRGMNMTKHEWYRFNSWRHSAGVSPTTIASL